MINNSLLVIKGCDKCNTYVLKRQYESVSCQCYDYVNYDYKRNKDTIMKVDSSNISQVLYFLKHDQK